ncbi:MAG: hypothetical protein ACYDAB_09815 [bacterium]
MPVDRRWYWLGAALAAAGIALVAGIPLGTVLYAAAILACPAAMFFGMGMMGGTQDREQGANVPTVQPRLEEASPSAVPLDDPIMILKRRLAAGEITVEEYKRVTAVISPPSPAVPRA